MRFSSFSIGIVLAAVPVIAAAQNVSNLTTTNLRTLTGWTQKKFTVQALSRTPSGAHYVAGKLGNKTFLLKVAPNNTLLLSRIID